VLSQDFRADALGSVWLAQTCDPARLCCRRALQYASGQLSRSGPDDHSFDYALRSGNDRTAAPDDPFELKEINRSAAGAAIGMILTFQNLGTFIYPILSGRLIDLFTPNYYPYFGAQMMAFVLTFLLVWRLVPETGPGAAQVKAS